MVLDTGVIVRALMGSTSAASYGVVDSAGSGRVRPALSDRGLLELSRIVEEEQERIVGPARAFEVASALWTHAALYQPRRHDWPSVGDVKDWWLLDLAYECGADYIVAWDEDLNAASGLGFEVLTPPQLLARL